MAFGLSTGNIALIVAIVFFILGFLVKKFLKWALILAVISLVAAGYFWFF